MMVCLPSRTVTHPAYVLDVLLPGPVLATQIVCLLVVAPDEGNVSFEVDVPVKNTLVPEIPQETPIQNWDQWVENAGNLGVQILEVFLSNTG